MLGVGDFTFKQNRSLSGKTHLNATFASTLTAPKYSLHVPDAGRVLQNIQKAA